MSKKNNNWIIGIITFILLFFAFGKYIQYSENQKLNQEILEKNQRQSKTIQGLYSSKIFGIKLNDRLDVLLFQLLSIPATYGNTDKVYDEYGFIKNSEDIYFNYTVNLNPFINDEGIENTRNDCLNMYKELEIEDAEQSCLRPIIKNDYFSEYFVKYHPFGYKIWSINAKSNNTFENKNKCIEDLKPYANVLMSKIKNENPSERIIIEDKFYPNETKPIIKFFYKSEIYETLVLKNPILTIEGNCTKFISSYVPIISLNAPLLQPNIDELKKIRKQISEKIKLNTKEDFDRNVKEKEQTIDTQGIK